jgi:lipid II:glycine glycyltransferase (peptidoglycan interpeptide bridge formation enzyme)
MPLPLGKYYLYAPYGPVGDLRFEILDFRFLMQELRRKFPDAVFARLEPKNSNLISYFSSLFAKTKNIQPGKTLIVDLSKSDEQLLGEMHHKTRYNIRLAQKHGVEVKDQFSISVGSGFFLREAVDLLVETAARQGYKGFNTDYYNKLISHFTLHNRGNLKLHVYKAVYQNKLLASAIMIDCGHTRTYLFGGSSDEFKNVMAPYLLHWQAMQDAKSAALKYYDFWGTETSAGKQAGFVRFKMGFGGQEKIYAGAWDYSFRLWQYKIYKLFRNFRRLF